MMFGFLFMDDPTMSAMSATPGASNASRRIWKRPGSRRMNHKRLGTWNLSKEWEMNIAWVEVELGQWCKFVIVCSWMMFLNVFDSCSGNHELWRQNPMQMWTLHIFARQDAELNMTHYLKDVIEPCLWLIGGPLLNNELGCDSVSNRVNTQC